MIPDLIEGLYKFDTVMIIIFFWWAITTPTKISIVWSPSATSLSQLKAIPSHLLMQALISSVTSLCSRKTNPLFRVLRQRKVVSLETAAMENSQHLKSLQKIRKFQTKRSQAWLWKKRWPYIVRKYNKIKDASKTSKRAELFQNKLKIFWHSSIALRKFWKKILLINKKKCFWKKNVQNCSEAKI